MKKLANVILSIWSYRIVRILIGGLFVWSGATKLSDLSSFATVMDAYGLIPTSLTNLAAFGLSGLELVAGIGLIADVKGSLGAILGMLALFILVLIYGIWMGLDVDCGCYGPGDPEGEAFSGLRTALIRDIYLVCAVFYLYTWRLRNRLRQG